MRYFLIAGEASGDLHAAHLVSALRKRDAEAEFRFFGGDEMAEAVGHAPLRHYRTLAYMGIVQVLLHFRTILQGLRQCMSAIREWKPDCVILVDYPGFNLKIARFVHDHRICPVYYYIAPKIWAWKEGRIRSIRQCVDHIFSILPFEKTFFEDKHHYPITYVGNPSVDEISQRADSEGLYFDADSLTIALLPGSRTAEISANLPVMLRAARSFVAEGYQLVVSHAPSQPLSLYEEIISREGMADVRVENLNAARSSCSVQAALVTSGTATLEIALLGIPQVVCYHFRGGRIINWLRPLVLNVHYISLPNLVCGREIIPELIAADFTPDNVRQHLASLLDGSPAGIQQLADYREMRQLLGAPGAAGCCAEAIIKRLSQL